MRTSCVNNGLVFGIIFLFIICMSITPSIAVDTIKKPSMPISNGNTLYVGGSGEGNYSKIQDAIDDASDGDTVFVYDDSSPYYENFSVNKSINLIGEDRNTTVIDGNGKGNVVEITADWITVSGFMIQNCAYGYNYAGIKIYSNHNIVKDNLISVNNEAASGILLSNYNSPCNNNTITGNKISSNEEFGIRLYKSSNNIISDNNISNNDYGIVLSTYSSNNIIINNNINSNKWEAIFISDNLKPCKNNTIIGNTISSNNYNGLYLLYSSNNNIIDNTISSNNGNGIRFYQSSNNYIKGNNIISNINAGIYLSGSNKPSKNNVIIDNTISLNNQGINLESNGNDITGNNISSNNGDGIFLCDYWYYCYNNTITGNNITSNNGDGIYLFSSDNTIKNNNIISNNDNGLFIVSNDNNITGNNISSNNGDGIYLWSSNNTIAENNINSNSGYGIELVDHSENNIIFHNNFIDNTDNAYDECDNIWDDGKYGNYWDDYKEIYRNAKKKPFKGIWDTPYNIPPGDNVDQYPLIKQWPKSKPRTVQRDTTSCISLLFKFLEHFLLLEKLLSLIRTG